MLDEAEQGMLAQPSESLQYDGQLQEAMSLLAGREKLGKISEHCNDRKLAARKAQEASDKVFLCLLLKAKPVIKEAIVLGLSEKFISCIIATYGVEKRIYMEDLPIYGYTFDHDHDVLVVRWPADPKEAIVKNNNNHKDSGNNKNNNNSSGNDNDNKDKTGVTVVSFVPLIPADTVVEQITELSSITVHVSTKPNKFPMDVEMLFLHPQLRNQLQYCLQ